jgi:tetratricopeptide (TPR) repeat protein
MAYFISSVLRLRSQVAAGMLIVACLVFHPAKAMAQSNMAGMQMKELPAPDKLPAPLKMTGLGNSHIAIKATPEAQFWFDQGLNEMHDFWDYESLRSFEQSVRVDPNCAMCYWGLYHALVFRNSGGSGYSQQALANAVRLKDHAGKAGQLYIEAAVASDDAAKAAQGDRPNNDKEVAVWRVLVKKYPGDVQARIFLAESVIDGYDENGELKKGTKEAIVILQDVLKTNPDDSAANHYWIHAVEASAHPEQALHSATILASLAPSSGHMVHMPGHIFYRVGDYAQAEHWFAASSAVDEVYMRSQHVDVDDDWNYVHNLMYGIADLMEEGKLAEAVTLSGKLPGARGQLRETLYTFSPRDSMSRIDPQIPVALRTGNWPHVLRLLQSTRPEASLENLTFLAGQLREFAAGMQAVESGDLAAAQSASVRLDADLWHMSQKTKDAPKEKKEDTTKTPLMVAVMPDALPAPLLSNLSVMSLELRASILAGQKHLSEAKALFAEAALEEKGLGYHEPPNYIRPVGEAEGAALMRAGDYTGAHQAYASALLERPKSGFILFGMARSSEAAGDAASARREYAEFTEAWRNGDRNLPQMEHARVYLGGPGAPGGQTRSAAVLP